MNQLYDLTCKIFFDHYENSGVLHMTDVNKSQVLNNWRMSRNLAKQILREYPCLASVSEACKTRLDTTGAPEE